MIEELAETYKSDLIGITESHLKTEINDAEVKIKGYRSFRGDRTEGKKKGGVIVYVSEHLAHSTRTVAKGSNDEVEYVILYVAKLGIMVITVYRPPGCSTLKFHSFLDIVRTEIRKIGTPEPTIVLNGDFNFPIINWSSLSIYGGSAADRAQSESLLRLMEEYTLQQLVKTATRGTNILDLFLTNNEELIVGLRTEDTILSDHRLVIIETTLHTNSGEPDYIKQTNSHSKLNFFHEKTDWVAINDELHIIQWKTEMENMNSEQVFKLIHSRLLDICQRHTPKRNQRRKQHSNIPRDRKILMRKRTKLVKRMSTNTTANNELRQNIEDMEKQLAESHEKEIRLEEQQAVSAIKQNPKYFFRYARSKAKCLSKVGPLEVNEELITEPKQIADALNDQYKSVFTRREQANELNVPNERDNVDTIDDIDLKQTDIEQAIAGISMYAAAGPDDIPAILLKKCTKTLSLPLMLLWRRSLDMGEIPAILKHGIISPIYKGGNRTHPKNYRPVGLTSHVIKIFERIMVKKLSSFMEKNSLHNNQQHGFRRGRSCLSQLMQHYMEILKSLEEGHGVDVIYLDFAKAFDKVNQTTLLQKLYRMGIQGKILRWFTNFFTDRSQSVIVEGVQSGSTEVLSGVVQGSAIGPILFLIYVIDIDQDMKYCKASSFADDTRLLTNISTEQHGANMQEDLRSMFQWAQNNSMEFNTSKFEMLRYRHPKADVINYEYKTPDNATITCHTSTRDLGITMSSDASFELQIDNMVSKGRQRMGWILRTFKTREPSAMLTLYKTMVLPIIEYCSQLWNPVTIGQIRKIEALQRTFTSKIYGTNSMNYWQRLKHLNLYSLERRRERYIIIYIWKIINDIVPNLNYDGENLITTYNNPRRGTLCRIPPMKRTWQRLQTQIEGSIIVNGPRLYNCLPKSVRGTKHTLTSFKKDLDGVLTTIPDQPCLPHYYQVVEGNSIRQQKTEMERRHTSVAGD